MFLAFVLVINTYYGIRLGRGEFSKYTCFWIFNACAIWSFCYLAEYGGKAFLTGINRVVKVNIGSAAADISDGARTYLPGILGCGSLSGNL